jgi:hypothetical protein
MVWACQSIPYFTVRVPDFNALIRSKMGIVRILNIFLYHIFDDIYSTLIPAGLPVLVTQALSKTKPEMHRLFKIGVSII